MVTYYKGRKATLAKGPGDGSAHQVTVGGTPYSIPEGQVGVILNDGRVIAADPSELITLTPAAKPDKAKKG